MLRVNSATKISPSVGRVMRFFASPACRLRMTSPHLHRGEVLDLLIAWVGKQSSIPPYNGLT
jgi:hypothetical protein